MSLKQRREIAYWFMLLVGIVLMTIQLIKYYNDELQYTTGEMIINVISVALMLFPRFILNMAEKFINSKKDENDA
ncbi:hypothetical protein [Flavobacterium sp.]|uniref:hypothetical protein n=1 Tax=Flavobacterium sp. TaxID=239 RepID=UPI003D6B643C